MKSGTFCGHCLVLTVPVVVRGTVAGLMDFLSGVVMKRLNARRVSKMTVMGRLVFICGLTMFKTISTTDVFKTRCFNGKGRGKRVCSFEFGLCTTLLIATVTVALFVAGKANFVSLCLASATKGNTARMTLTCKGRCLRVIVVNLVPFTIARTCTAGVGRAKRAFMPVITDFTTIKDGTILSFLLVFKVKPVPGLNITKTTVTAIVSQCVRAVVIIL